MRANFFIASVSWLLLASSGCDTQYAYNYHGVILNPDGGKSAPGARIVAGIYLDASRPDLLEDHSRTSDVHGEYHGYFLGAYSTPLSFRPAPPLPYIWVYVREIDGWRGPRLELTKEQQSQVGWGTRTLELPPIRANSSLMRNARE